MNFKQYLREAISLTHRKEHITHFINTGIKYLARDLLQAVTDHHDNIDSHKAFWKVILDTLHDRTVPDITNAIIQKMGVSPYNVGRVYFSQQLKPTTGGYANGNQIVINYSYLDAVQEAIVNHISNYSDNIISSENDYHPNMEEFKHTLKSLTDNDSVKEVVNKIANIILHELVHVTQHSKQHKLMAQEAKTEYRSYLTKSKTRFNQAINDKLTKEDLDIYFGSPQEIDAFAHNLAMELIDIASNQTPLSKYKDYWKLYGLYLNLVELKTDTLSMKYSYYYKQYQDFNDPTNYKRYKVFKRFMKKVYQEFDRYIDRVRKKLKLMKEHPESWEMIQQEP